MVVDEATDDAMPDDVDEALWHLHEARKALPEDVVSVGPVIADIGAVMEEVADRFDILPAEAVYRASQHRADRLDEGES